MICSTLASLWKFQYFRRPVYNPVEHLWWSFYCGTRKPLECVHLTKWHQYIFSVSLKFGTCYITDQCGEFTKKMLLNAFMYFFGIFFVVFHPKICVFIIFISFSDKVSNFRNRILTNQKRELVISNCQRNYMVKYIHKKAAS